MKVLITGAKGFIGSNLCVSLEQIDKFTVYSYDTENSIDNLKKYVENSDFIFHLAGVNRPNKSEEFMTENSDFTKTLLDILKNSGKSVPILLASSIQAESDNLYGKSKKSAEELVFKYSEETGNSICVYRLHNVFGKWCRPNYNSVVATFCYNIARNLPVSVHDPERIMELVYIDDVVDEFIRAADGNENREDLYCHVAPIYDITLEDLRKMIESFSDCRDSLEIPNVGDSFIKKMYSTYLSYLPEDDFCFPLKMNRDDRGSFTEIFRMSERGQVSVNIIKPGIVKGNHWHHTKVEKFITVQGSGIVRFRKIDGDDIFDYHVDGNNPKVIDIPPGYTHNIENTGTADMVVIIWCSECFDEQNPDTFWEKV